MKRIFSCQLSLIVCLSFMTASLYPCASFAETCEQWVATVVSVQGSVEVQRAGETQWQTVKLNDTFCPDDKIRVDERSRAGLTLVNQPVLRLDQNTSITLGGVKEKRTSIVELAKGALHFFSRVRRNLEVVTGFVNAGVEGTEGFIRVEQDKTFISIFEGQVLASNAVGSLTLTSGQSAVAEAGKAPVLRAVVRPRDAVHWALYYLPVMFVPPGEAPKEDMGDPHFLAYRASQLLAVGRVGEAGADIQRALSLDPRYSDAFALQAIIAVVQNEKDKALNSAQKAVETGPSSATAHIAISYARQAGFDLEGARASVEEAVKLDPNNALAWARLAELWSSFGYLGKALDAAKKAVELDPSLSRTQMVLGFAYLTQVKTTKSRAAFEKAIELDQADPLSRLGLGLAKIRIGDLKAGGREIEIAASLDPNNSIVRSYLGKAYFDEKQNKLARDEFAIAKELDPLDPTPWFYDAIRKQTINRPVEALQDMQKSIELNDNRVVYRSRLLLDEDLAARSASLGRIYNDLGFQQLGLVEGWKSVNTTPANHSAHRLLADLYAALPRHEIARVSELLQSQLLQPINITPVQPQLAESSLSVLEDSGPSALSFSEFNPLFASNGARVQANGVVGNNSTWGDDLVFSGILGTGSFSLGQFHFETNGFRPNNDLDEDIYNFFGQLAITHKFNFQFELRQRKKEQGDIDLNFEPEDFSTDDRREVDQKTARIGTHLAISPRSDLLLSLIYSDRKGDILQTTSGPTIDEENKDNGSQIEVQYQYKFDPINLVAGIGTYDIDADQETVFDWTPVFGIKCPPSPPFPSVPCEQEDSFTRRHDTAYVYTNVNFPQSVTWTLGFSYDSIEQRAQDDDEFNPKFGIQWDIMEKIRLRAAYTESVKRILIVDQTIEPTQVAGFNQFFDDVNGTLAKRYGVGVDAKILNNLYGGLELSRRDLEEPEFESGMVTFTDRDEDFYRAYLYWTLRNRWAASAEYQYEEIEREGPGITKLKTTKVPLALRYFGPKGFFGELGSVYVDQEVSQESPLADGEEDFVIFNLKLGYRLPKRWGLVSLEVQNLFDEDFQFQDLNFISSEPASPEFIPDRTFLLRATLSF